MKMMNLSKKVFVGIMAFVITMSLSGCFDSEKNKIQAAETSAQSSDITSDEHHEKLTPVNAVTNEQNAPDELAFGRKTAFGGIAVETDENGEMIMKNVDGTILIKVTDVRFGSLHKLERFVKNSFSGDMKKNMTSAVKSYFTELDGELYLINGSGVRTISDSKKYTSSCYDEGCDMQLTISSMHTKSCRKQCGLLKSHMDFIRSNGVWQLDDITLYY